MLATSVCTRQDGFSFRLMLCESLRESGLKEGKERKTRRLPPSDLCARFAFFV